MVRNNLVSAIGLSAALLAQNAFSNDYPYTCPNGEAPNPVYKTKIREDGTLLQRYNGKLVGKAKVDFESEADKERFIGKTLRYYFCDYNGSGINVIHAVILESGELREGLENDFGILELSLNIERVYGARKNSPGDVKDDMNKLLQVSTTSN